MSFNYELDKSSVLEKCATYWNPGKTREWQEMNIDLVIGKREGYFLYDLSGKRLIDVHLNGGTFNLGHRNPEVIAALKESLEHFDIGNHHFPSVARAQLAEKLVGLAPEGLKYAIFGSSGGEAIDVALKCARYATKRTKIVSIKHCYHGHTGLAVACGDDRFSTMFLAKKSTDEHVHVPFNDLDAMEAALKVGDAACVIMETIPATYGFPMPKEGYLPAVKALCEKYGALYIADEVQTGLMRCGELWGITTYGVTPDILVTAKGLSGGIYPITAVLVNEQAGGWMKEDGFAHMSTFGGAEVGCAVACKVLDITTSPETKANVAFLADYILEGLKKIQAKCPEFFTGIRAKGVIFGLEFANSPEGGKHAMRGLYENGVWAIYSSLDFTVLQYKVGLLVDKELADDLLARTELGILAAARASKGG
jgi:acetylornithine/succinyldiaminopimelate/putrescine aminotransferase